MNTVVKRLEEEDNQALMLAALGGLHARLGKESKIMLLDECIMGMIWQYLCV